MSDRVPDYEEPNIEKSVDMRFLTQARQIPNNLVRKRVRKSRLLVERLEPRAMLAVAAVESLTAVVRTGEVGLSWLAPSAASGASITDYVVQYRGEASQSWATFPDGQSILTAAVVTGLATGEKYDFRVAAVTTTGQGMWSHELTTVHAFSNELLVTADWIAEDPWRLESAGTRLLNNQASLTSRQVFGSETQQIQFSYEITARTQVWAALWGETFVLESPAGGGAVTARITRNGEAVTFDDGVTAPTTVILKQANKDVATPLFLQMDQRNLWRPEMELLLKQVAVTKELRTTPTLPSAPTALVAFPSGFGNISLGWAAPSEGGSPITDYLVQYRAANGGTWTDFTDGMSSHTSQNVGFLDSKTEYVLRVAAVNAIGIGPWSTASLPTTPGSLGMPTDTRHYVFSHEGWLDSSWMADGRWRLEADGTRLLHHQSQLTSRQLILNRHTQRIEIAYEITDQTQMWVSLWGETFKFESSAGGGAAIAEIIRNGEAVTFSNGITPPITVVLKQQNKDVATPLVIQMDQRNLYRPTMELLVKRVSRTNKSRLLGSPGLPNAPATVAVAPGNGPRDVQLFWTAPGVWDLGTIGAPITDYLIQSSGDAGASWADLTTNISVLTYDTVTNLDPSTEYVFRVAAVNAVGIGPWSTASVPVRPTTDVVMADTQQFGFSHEGWLDASWTADGIWRLESDGIRLQHWTSSLTSKQSFGSETQQIQFSYEITDRTQMWASLWGETFVFESPAGGGAVTARITRNGEAVTFDDGVTAPTTVILKQANKDVATPLFLQMDQRNLSRLEMELLLKQVVAVQQNNDFAVLPISEFPEVLRAYERRPSGSWRIWSRDSFSFGEEQDFYFFEYDWLYLVDPITGPRYTVDTTRPYAPLHIWVAPGDTGGSMSVSWIAPRVWEADPVGGITDYLVQYSDDSGGSWVDYETVTSTVTEQVVTNLDPNTEYVFRVAAANARGTSDWSEASAASLPSPISGRVDTQHFRFSHEGWLDASWTADGMWRLESDGIRLQHWTSSLTSKQSFGSETESIEFSYEITDQTQMWVSIWGETFVFEPPAGGGPVTARITRNDGEVTFSNGITSPTTVILKQVNKDGASPLLIQMDQRNMYRLEMELLLQALNVTTAPAAPAEPARPVTVTGVYVRGSGWNAGYLARTPFTTLDGAALGWELPDGSAQLADASSISWNNVDVISIRFGQPIAQPAADALQLVLGTAEGNRTILPTAAPTLLAGGTVAQWTLPASLASGRYVISIAAAGITNAAGTATLDGEWTTSSSTFGAGSGDGTAGGSFNFFFNALVGDVNGNGSMSPTDIATIRSSLTSPFNTPLAANNSNYRLDLNGSNSLNSTDLSQTRAQLTSALGTTLSSLPAVTAPVESTTRSAGPFAAFAEEGEDTLATGLSAEAWAWYGIENGCRDKAKIR